jgi:phosphoribosylglycinamide formyltransferase-1
MNIAIFASGGGSNFQAILDRVDSKELDVNIALFVSNSSRCKAMQRANSANIETLHISPSHFDRQEEYTSKLIEKLQSAKIELIVLAGYMKMIPPKLIEKFQDRIINIHPALLPSFGGEGMYGMNIHRAVVEHGVVLTGITIHFVNEEYDRGVIIYQEGVRVYPTDTPEEVASRVLKVEHSNYWRVIDAISKGEISTKDGRLVGFLK